MNLNLLNCHLNQLPSLLVQTVHKPIHQPPSHLHQYQHFITNSPPSSGRATVPSSQIQTRDLFNFANNTNITPRNRHPVRCLSAPLSSQDPNIVRELAGMMGKTVSVNSSLKLSLVPPVRSPSGSISTNSTLIPNLWDSTTPNAIGRGYDNNKIVKPTFISRPSSTTHRSDTL